MNNVDVIKNFLEGKQAQTPKRWNKWGEQLQTLHTEGNELYNYNTVIARLNGTEEQTREVEINANYYSNTTSRIQTLIINIIKMYRRNGREFIVVLNGTEKRIEWLEKYLKA